MRGRTISRRRPGFPAAPGQPTGGCLVVHLGAWGLHWYIAPRQGGFCSSGQGGRRPAFGAEIDRGRAGPCAGHSRHARPLGPARPAGRRGRGGRWPTPGPGRDVGPGSFGHRLDSAFDRLLLPAGERDECATTTAMSDRARRSTHWRVRTALAEGSGARQVFVHVRGGRRRAGTRGPASGPLCHRSDRTVSRGLGRGRLYRDRGYYAANPGHSWEGHETRTQRSLPMGGQARLRSVPVTS